VVAVQADAARGRDNSPRRLGGVFGLAGGAVILRADAPGRPGGGAESAKVA